MYGEIVACLSIFAVTHTTSFRLVSREQVERREGRLLITTWVTCYLSTFPVPSKGLVHIVYLPVPSKMEGLMHVDKGMKTGHEGKLDGQSRMCGQKRIKEVLRNMHRIA